MTLPQQSPKRKSEIASGKLKMRGTFVIKASELKANPKAQAALFSKGKDSQREARKKAKAKADKWFSEWIRLRDSDEHGIATCITSGKRAFWRTMDCGHYLSRAKEGVRYDERNCHAQSKMANRFQGGHFMEHGFRIEEKYGRGTCHELAMKAMRPCKRTVNDYLFLADTYKKRVELIKANEPERYGRS
jgi:Bacteriophage Lambda NinG protein